MLQVDLRRYTTTKRLDTLTNPSGWLLKACKTEIETCLGSGLIHIGHLVLSSEVPLMFLKEDEIKTHDGHNQLVFLFH